MAGRRNEHRSSDDFQYLAAPQPIRDYHSDEEVCENKRVIYDDRGYESMISRELTTPSPPPQSPYPRIVLPHSRIPSPPLIRIDRRRFSSHDVRSLRPLSAPRHSSPVGDPIRRSPSDGGYGNQPKVHHNEDKSLDIEWELTSRNPRARGPSHNPQRAGTESPFPEAKIHRVRRRHRHRSDSVDRLIAASRPSLDVSQRSLSLSEPGTLSEKVYRYNYLGESEIRLLRLLPARMTKIKCEVFHAAITNPPRYVAISYAWGDERDTRRLELGGIDLPVPVSLHGALDALRRRNEMVTLWVDALCINQKNSAEKTQQVQLMTEIYSKAESVAVWLGAESDRSFAAVRFLQKVADRGGSPTEITKLLSSKSHERDVTAAVSLFERDYWKRLWVVQEVFNARSVTVYCGSTKLPWDVYREASRVFQRHKGDLDYYFPGNSQGRTYARASQNHFTCSQILTYQGPGSLPEIRALRDYGTESLLEVMRACRKKFASVAKDKVFGILGLLSEDVRCEFTVDYGLSVKEIFTNVVDIILWTTRRLDVICESIHYPLHMNVENLPSWLPDWSHIPDTAAIGAMKLKQPFSASGDRRVEFCFKDERRNKLEITGIEIDTIDVHGIAVGTLCGLADYLMAFIHWRAIMLSKCEADDLEAQDMFCRALCLNQVPDRWCNSFDWMTICFHVFASFIRERLPQLPMDRELEKYVDAEVAIEPDAHRRFLQEHFGSRMMGRCFYITKDGRPGLGSGFMTIGDVVVVPFGCSTPVILRPEGCHSEYRYVGDAYLHGFMYGKAIDQWRKGQRKASKFILH